MRIGTLARTSLVGTLLLGSALALAGLGASTARAGGLEYNGAGTESAGRGGARRQAACAAPRWPESRFPRCAAWQGTHRDRVRAAN